jgi:hypothetical protein
MCWPYTRAHRCARTCRQHNVWVLRASFRRTKNHCTGLLCKQTS